MDKYACLYTQRNGATVFTRGHYRGFNIQMDNYEHAKARYESVKPIGGIRKKLGGDFRPAADRYRTWECFLRDGDAYGIGFYGSYIIYRKEKDAEGKTKHIPESLNGEPKPMLMFQPDGVIKYTPWWTGSYTTWEFLAAALPPTIRFAKYGAKQYLEFAKPDGSFEYYLAPRDSASSMRFIPYESDGKVFYMPHDEDKRRESKVLIDPEKSKIARAEWKAFKDYYAIMADLICADVEKEKIGDWGTRRASESILEKRDWLIRKDGEEYGALWADSVKALFLMNTHRRVRWDAGSGNWGEPTYEYCTVDTLNAMNTRTLYKYAKPYRKVDVPLGVGFRDTGRAMK